MAAISFFLASSLALLRASASADFGVAGMAFLAPALRLEKENNLEVLSAYLYFNQEGRDLSVKFGVNLTKQIVHWTYMKLGLHVLLLQKCQVEAHLEHESGLFLQAN